MGEIARINTATVRNGHVVNVVVEVQVQNGIGIHMVGISDAKTREVLLRIVTALQALGFNLPGKKIVINIAPGNGGIDTDALDLPVAIGILQASGQIKVEKEVLEQCLFYGELALDGTIMRGGNFTGAAIATATAFLHAEDKCLVTDTKTAIEGLVVPNIFCYGFSDLPTLLRVIQRAIVGTSYLAWMSGEWKQREESIKYQKELAFKPL